MYSNVPKQNLQNSGHQKIKIRFSYLQNEFKLLDAIIVISTPSKIPENLHIDLFSVNSSFLVICGKVTLNLS